MPRGEVQPELVNASPVLAAVIQTASDEARTGEGLVTEVNGIVADVATEAFKTGVRAMLTASRVYRDPEEAADRMVLHADLASLDLHDRDRWTTHSDKVTKLIDSMPSYIPFDPSECAPPGGFTDQHREGWQQMTQSLLANFKLCDSRAFEAIAAEMGYVYYKYLQAEGMSGEELLNHVKAFEVKQAMLIRESASSGNFRQPDQDDHAFEHYLETLSNACMPVWKALSGVAYSR